MNLLYLWNEEYGDECFWKKGFTFSSKYQFVYDADENKINISKNDNFVEKFWGNNIFDICAIVGENGSGKTVLSNYIINSIGYLENDDVTYNFFAVFEDEIENKINIYITEKYSNIICNKNFDIEVEYNMKRPFDVFKEYKIAYFTNALSISDYQYKKIGYVADFSLGSLLRNNYKMNLEMHYKGVEDSIIHNYYSCEFEKVIKFIFYSAKHNNIDIPFPMPKNIEISLNKYSLNIEYIMKQINSIKGYDKKVKEIVEKYKFDLSLIVRSFQKKYENSWVNTLLINLIINIFKEMAIPQITIEKKRKEIVEFIDLFQFLESNIKEYPTMFDLVIKYLEIINEKIAKNQYYEEMVKFYYDFTIWIEENESYFTDKCNVNNICRIPVTENDENIILEILKYYSHTSFPFQFFSFNCSLSTGEYNFLSIFSNLFFMFKLDANDNKKLSNNTVAGTIECKNVLLIFDEADLSLHPRWQQKYLLWIIQFTTSLFRKYNIQIIITTHSPIMLSDFPRDNVIYIDKKINLFKQGYKRNLKTFGNNIHTLFLDSFFLDDEGTVGAFAEMKINEIVRMLMGTEKIEDDNKNIFKIINYVGDELVRNKLIEFYKIKFGQTNISAPKYNNDTNAIDITIEVIKEQVKQLQSTIFELEKLKNDKNTIG